MDERELIRQGFEYLELNNLALAEECFNKAIKINRNSAEAYFGLGCVYYLRNQTEPAIQSFRRAIEVNPHNGEAHFKLGNLFYDEGHIDEAEVHYRKAIEIAPEYSGAYFNLGNLLDGLGRLDEAEHYFRKVVEINPERSSAYNGLGVIYDKRGNEQEAYEYFKIAVCCDSKDLMPHLNLCLFDIETNPDKLKHLYRGLYLSILQNNFKYVVNIAEELFSIDAPMLAYNIVRLAPIEVWNQATHFLTDIQESISKTEFFRQQIQVWRHESQHPQAGLLSEALINYHLGDPIRAYQIFDDEMDTEDVGLDLCGRYYFCLSSAAIIEEEEPVLAYAVKQAKAALSHTSGLSLREQYYAGLIPYLNGEYEQAIEVLKRLFPDFLPAGYKLAEIYEALYARDYKQEWGVAPPKEGLHSPEAKSLVQLIDFEESNHPTYKFGLETIIPSLDATQFLEDIMPVVHFMEVQEMVGQIFTKPVDIRSAFFNCIKLAEGDIKKESLLVKDKAAKAWQQVVEQELDQDELEDLFGGYSGFRKPAKNLGEFIQLGAKAELLDFKERHRNSVRFNFKLYLALNFRLFKEGKITQSEAASLNNYMYICMDVLPVFKGSDAKQFLVNSIRDQFLEDTSLYIPYVQKLLKLITLLHKEIKGRQSPILDFEEYCSIYQQAEEQAK